MAEKKIKRIVISPSKKDLPPEEKAAPKDVVSPLKEDRSVEEKLEETGRPKRACFFCQSKTNPSYTDTSSLRRFVTDRAKIVPKLKSNLCSKHQRTVTKQIKYARHLSLLPFTPKI